MNNKRFYDASDSYHINVTAPATLTANHLVKFPDSAGTLSIVDNTETLTNKTLTSPIITTPVVDGVTYSTRNSRQVIIEAISLVGNTIQLANTDVWVAPANCIILQCLLNITTKSSGASTLNIGYNTTSGQNTDTMFDGIDTGTAIGFYDSLITADAGTNALVKAQKAASGKYLVATAATGNTNGMLGTLYITYILV